jgi:ribonuclease HI
VPDFECADCGKSFVVRPDVLERYRGWRPRQCLPCRNGAAAASGSLEGSARRLPQKSARAAARPSAPPAAASADPHAGLFTDGACSGNPGPGGWGVVWVRDGEIQAERSGSEPRTTNNRMELRALIEAYRLLPGDSAETVWSDSKLCVQTVNEWAAAWERQGWRRKSGPVENLDLVRELWALAQSHPRVELRWLKGHAGQRWNEYADHLATGGAGVRPTGS